MKHFLIAIVIISSFVPYASAAQLDAAILSGEESTNPSFQFLRVVYIEYPNNGKISEELRGKNKTISFTADYSTQGMNDLIMSLNKNLKNISSDANITDVKINYHSMLQGNDNCAVIEYKIQLVPTITDHILARSFEKSTVDANWRGISLDESVVLQTTHGSFDINNPKSALDIMIPNVSEKFTGIAILELPLIDASGILELPLHKWHSLFDNTAIISGAAEYKYVGKNVITLYSMG